MSPKERSYPFEAASLREVTRGDVWAIPIEGKKYAFGVVLEMHPENRREFLGGLLDLTDDVPPDFAAINESQILRHGIAGIRMITRSGNMVWGNRNLDTHPIEIPETLSHVAGNVQIERGYSRKIRTATPEEMATLKVTRYYNYDAFRTIANSLLG